MVTGLKRFAPLLWVVMVLGSAVPAGAQADPLQFMFNSGQTIQPFFDGWTHNPDGGFEMHFGYLNRNYVEELHVPIGAGNYLSPDAEDQGQPTYFYPRVHHRVFSVTVPADWDDRRLIWQVTTQGETYRAEGWLQPEWEIFADPRSQFLRNAGGADENVAPTLTIDPTAATNRGDSLTLSAMVGDDGLPEAMERRPPRPSQPPTFQPQEGPTLPVNVPQVHVSARKRPTRTAVDRVNVTWTQLRGPTGASVKAVEDTNEGTTAVTVAFSSAGDYLFRVEATDGLESVTREVAVTVN